MRYAAEFRRAWEGASGQAIDAGKKLLGYLANQKRLSGVDSLVKRITLDDGTIVEARWDMNIPTVRIYPGDGTEGCELYVESGMLDLGPNIASDANERFNRGLPVFDDSPATLHFGDDVTCADGVEGLNGVVHVTQRQIASQCLPSAGPSVTSRLTSPVKKQAQAVLPASCWSGLMQRYVQAVYGGDALDYSASTTTLTVEGATIDARGSVGLIAVGGNLRFCAYTPDSGNLTIYACRPKTPCVRAALDLWRSMPDEDEADKARKSKVLTVALSGCVPGQQLQVVATGVSGNVFFTSKRPAMHFSDDGRRAAVVVENGGTATAYSLEFTINTEGDVAVNATSVMSAAVFNGDSDAWPLYVAGDPSPYGSGGAVRAGFEGETKIGPGASFDFPVYALARAEGLEIVRYSLMTTSRIETIGNDCSPFEQAPIWLDDDGDPPCSTNVDFQLQVASGYYATGPSGPLWSTVEITRIAEKDTGGAKHTINYVFANSLSVQLTGGPASWDYELSDPSIYWPPDQEEIDYWGRGDCLMVNLDLAGTRPVGAIESWDIHRDGCNLHSEPALNGCGCPAVSRESPPNTCEYSCVSFDAIQTVIMHTVSQSLHINALGIGGDEGGSATIWSPAPHLLSMCAGSYEFVVDRYSLSAIEGKMVNKIQDYDALVSQYESFSRTGTYQCGVPDGPGDPCTAPRRVVATGLTFTDEYSGVPVDNPHPEAWVFSNTVSTLDYEHEDTKIWRQGTERYNAWSSYGQTFTKTGGQSFNVTDEVSGSFSLAEGDDVLVGLCPHLEHMHLDPPDHEPIESITGDSDGEVVEWVKNAPLAHAEMVGGFTYACATSLLGARVTHTLSLDRGASIGMDRQSITHGYPTVSTPSFVGFA